MQRHVTPGFKIKISLATKRNEIQNEATYFVLLNALNVAVATDSYARTYVHIHSLNRYD